ncbi:S41 family peptidase [Fimbriimonas ginsengisoli]|uniref:Putative exported carboxyl-terminal protease protein n=1 Tax=Fimbriimonas ginsengisoli Gsoil 348 TaxID=661478 RepID=A0A068NW90_FIMGI|nr:S41 family peptidase [Fimbriimonas ginsengisoli]AIE85874.1 putative exported carboxyl-terminal protease protein [Fimbriimonas ginsengisoli Gsoil 348]
MPPLTLLAAFALAQTSDNFPKLWEQVSSSISSRYYARKTRGEEMNRLLEKYKPIATEAHSRAEFSKAVNDMIAEFHDSHFAFYGDDQQGYYVMDGLLRRTGAAEMPNIGAWYRLGPDGYTVQMVVNGGPAEAAGIRKGDKILAADGKPFKPVASFGVDGNVKLSILRGYQRWEKEVKPQKGSAVEMFLDGTRDSVRVIDQGPKKIGYIHVWTLASDAFRNALAGAVYGKLSETDAIVLDLRDGFGGRPEGFADPFFRPEARLEWKTSFGDSKQLFGYQRPLIVLINEGSRSAKEVLSLILKKSGRATLVGSTTAGNVLGTFPQRLSDWAYIEIPMTDVITDGVRLEGRGVDPDVRVPKEFDAEGHDLYLSKALEILTAKLKK